MSRLERKFLKKLNADFFSNEKPVEQLDIFSLPIQKPHELPEPILQNIDPQIEEAIAALREIKKEVIAQFQVGTRVVSGDLHGEVVSVIDEILCMVRFDGETKPRQVFTDSLSIEYKPVLVEGCTVRSSTSFKKQTGKLIRFEEIAGIEFAIVEYLFNGSTIQYPCTIATLEVVE